MNKEQLFLLSCLSDHIRKKKTTVPESLNWDDVLLYAQQQQTEGIIAYQSNRPDLQPKIAISTYYAANRQNELERIQEKLKEQSIPYLFFKGADIARYYPIPVLRTMGDVDILVHPADKEAAYQVLNEMGFNCTTRNDYEWPCYKEWLEIELHHEIANKMWAIDQAQKEFCDDVWHYAESEDGLEYHLELEYHLIYLLIHLKKHFMNNGVGFRQFMDLAVISMQDLNWNKITEYLLRSDMMPFAQTCYGLVRLWFGVSTAIGAKITDSFFEEATQQIFANGVFGFDDADNRLNKTTTQIRSGKRKVIVFLRKIFPDYEYLCNTGPFSFVRGKPYLMPAAWIYRFWYDIKNGYVKSGLRIAVSPYMKKKQIQKREAYLKKWGL